MIYGWRGGENLTISRLFFYPFLYNYSLPTHSPPHALPHAAKIKTMLEQKIIDMIKQPVADMGYRLVRVKLLGAKRNPILQIMAERLDDKPMGIEDCEAISRHVAVLFDTAEVMADRYRLEVSSPGVDRPLITPQDFQKNLGHLCSLYLKESSEKGRRIKAVIKEMVEENGNWRLRLSYTEPNMQHNGNKKVKFKDKNKPGNQKPPEEIEINFDNIDTAQLVMTEELMREALKKMNDENKE
ncbi:MAG: ribosome maturation factor RimP [Hydrotalea sp.]|nr:ribosome maturation factor RimP [Hydrotalea sp.]